MIMEEETKQFDKGFESGLGKKLLEVRQANEFTSVDKNQEGICYMCFKKDVVTATIIDVCYKCASKKGAEPILAVVKRIPYGYCYIHGGYSILELPNNLAQINVRVCMKCQKKIASKHKHLRHHGTHKIDPFWKSLRRKEGKDYIYAGFFGGGSTRR